VNAANSLIKKNTEQIFKNVFSKNDEGEKLEVAGAFSDFEEGLIVSNKIARMRYEEHASYGDFAILYRTNAQSRIFEEALRKKTFPHRIYGGVSFYQRKEIKECDLAIFGSSSIPATKKPCGASSITLQEGSAKLHSRKLRRPPNFTA